MYTPDFTQFKEYCKSGNLIPVYKELIADMETPLSVLTKLANNEKNAFLMESVEKSEHIGRYSFIGTNPRAVVRIIDSQYVVNEGDKTYTEPIESDPFSGLKKILDRYKPVVIPGLPRFCGGAVGYFGYGMINFFEHIPQNNPDDLKLPEAYFMITDTIVVFDHAKNKILVVSNTHINNEDDPKETYDAACADIDAIIQKLAAQISIRPSEMMRTIEEREVTSNMTRDEYENAVERAREYIRAGDIFQVVLSQRFSTQTTASPINLYRALRSINPSPYMFYLHFGDFQIVGSSPEIMVRCEDRVVEVRPIAGTRRRGRDKADDLRLEKELLADPKERSEHIMLVDLGRNDVGRVCQFNTVTTDPQQFMSIEYYSHVMHIVSDVTGVLKDGYDAFDVVRAAFPAGTVSGAPKIRAMEIIEELEKSKRGLYAGAVGYFSFHGNLDTAIAIRTLVLKDNVVYIQAGGGIVADSQPPLEFLETQNKARALVHAISLAEHLEMGESQ